MSPSLAALNALSEPAFVARFGTVFEHAPWAAARAASERPFASVATLRAAVVGAVAEAGEERQLALLRAHPVLAGAAARAGGLEAASAAEQAGAGLDRLEAEEERGFAELNAAYLQRFGFPFIIAVRGARDRSAIRTALELRLEGEAPTERRIALAEVIHIANFRLDDLLAGCDETAPAGFVGRLSLHVLDTARGCPGTDMAFTLVLLEHQIRIVLGDWRADEGGRWTHNPDQHGGALPIGTYEIVFAAGAYLQRQATPGFYDDIPIRVQLGDPDGRYHVPLILSPFGYATYRGS